MPNPIKYNVSAQTLALKKGNFWIGTNDSDKGPTSNTNYWMGVTPPSGGFTIYLNKASNGPSIYTVTTEAQLTGLTSSLAGVNYTTSGACLNWFVTQTDKMIFNIDYPSIITSGLTLNIDAGFTPSYPTTGTTWYDLSGNNYDGTLINGPTFDSANNGSIQFNGTNNYATVPQQPSLSNVSQFTLCVWMKRTSTSSRLITLAGVAGSTKVGLYFQGAGGSEDFTICNGGNTSVSIQAANAGPTDWRYCVAVFDGSLIGNTNRAKIYLNGVLQTCIANGTIPATTGNVTTTLDIGRYSDFNYYQTGNTGIVQIYNRALSSNEILQNYNATKGRYGL